MDTAMLSSVATQYDPFVYLPAITIAVVALVAMIVSAWLKARHHH